MYVRSPLLGVFCHLLHYQDACPLALQWLGFITCAQFPLRHFLVLAQIICLVYIVGPLYRLGCARQPETSDGSCNGVQEGVRVSSMVADQAGLQSSIVWCGVDAMSIDWPCWR